MKFTEEEIKKIIHEEFEKELNESQIDEKIIDKLKGFVNKFRNQPSSNMRGITAPRVKDTSIGKQTTKQPQTPAQAGVTKFTQGPSTSPLPAAAKPQNAVQQQPAAVQPAQTVKPIDAFLQSFEKLSNEAVKNDLNVDGIVGNIIAKTKNGKLVMLPASDPKAKPAFDAALKAAEDRAARAQPWHANQDLGSPQPLAPSAPQPWWTGTGQDVGKRDDKLEESKNLSYKTTYDKWQKIIKG